MIPGLLAAIAVFSYLLGGLNGARDNPQASR